MSGYQPGPQDRITRDGSPDAPPHVLDEVVLTDVTVHLERMANDFYSLMIYAGSPEDNWLNVTLYAPRGRPRRCEAFVMDRWGFSGTRDDYEEPAPGGLS